MTKTQKIIYLSLVGLSIIGCLVAFFLKSYTSAIWMALSSCWTFMMYRSHQRIYSLLTLLQEVIVVANKNHDISQELKQENQTLKARIHELETQNATSNGIAPNP